jgi:hypothetical protein
MKSSSLLTLLPPVRLPFFASELFRPDWGFDERFWKRIPGLRCALPGLSRFAPVGAGNYPIRGDVRFRAAWIDVDKAHVALPGLRGRIAASRGFAPPALTRRPDWGCLKRCGVRGSECGVRNAEG